MSRSRKAPALHRLHPLRTASPMTPNAIVYTAYVTCLLALGFGLSGAWRRMLALDPLERTATVLMANWAFNTAYVLGTGIYDPWWWFIVTDAAAARLVIHQPAGKAQALIAALYMIQIAMHAVYFASDKALAAMQYWWVLIGLAIVQLVILGGWASGGIARYVRRRRNPGMAASAREKSVGP